MLNNILRILASITMAFMIVAIFIGVIDRAILMGVCANCMLQMIDDKED